MGVNLILESLDGRRHPSWDPLANGGHKYFARDVLPKLPCKFAEGEDESSVYRPADFPAWRHRLAWDDIPNKAQFAAMLDILESQPEFWIYVSQ